MENKKKSDTFFLPESFPTHFSSVHYVKFHVLGNGNYHGMGLRGNVVAPIT